MSAVVGIAMAYHGFGVWALVAQYLTNTTIDTIVLTFSCGWKPSFRFSFKRMKSLYSYGWKLLASELIGTLYTELRGIILSTNFAPVELSYYNQGRKYPDLFIHNIEASMHKVLFQKLSDVQDELQTVKRITRETIEITTFILCPVYFGMASCGKIIIEIILTEKWLPCVPYMQIICFTDLMHPIFSAHTRAMKALGKSKTVLIISILRYSMGLAFLFLSFLLIRESHAIIISTTVALFFTCVCCGYVSVKSFHYTFKEQLQDVYKTLLIGLVMLVIVQLVGRNDFSKWISFALQVITGVVVYGTLSLLFNKKLCRKLINVAKSKILKMK